MIRLEDIRSASDLLDLFIERDDNRDGFLTQRELSPESHDAFVRIDADKNGQLFLREIASSQLPASERSFVTFLASDFSRWDAVSLERLRMAFEISPSQRSDILFAFRWLQSSPSFDPSTFDRKTLTVFCENLRYISRAGGNEGKALFSLYLAALTNPHLPKDEINPAAMRTLHAIIRVVLSSPNARHINEYGIALKQLISNHRFTKGMLGSVLSITRRCPLRLDVVADALKALSANPDLSFERADLNFFHLLSRTIRALKRSDPRQIEGNMELLGKVLTDPDFEPSFLRQLTVVLERAGSSASVFLILTLAALRNPNIHPRDLTGSMLVRLLDRSKRIIRLSHGSEPLRANLERVKAGGDIPSYQASGIYLLCAYSFLLMNPSFQIADIDAHQMTMLEQIITQAIFTLPPEAHMTFISALSNPELTPSALNAGLLTRIAGAINALMAVRGMNRDSLGEFHKALTHSRELFRHLNLVAANFEEGRKLARAVGADAQDPGVCMNFAYALSMIGKSRTRELHQRMGVTYFMRYSREVLLEAHANLDPKRNRHRPVLLVVNNQADYNGAFYATGSDLMKLTRHYRVVISEVDSERKFVQRISSVSRSFGRINTCIIGAHGEPLGMQLGPANGFEDERFLDITDGPTVLMLKPFFVEKPTVILNSCSSGQGVRSIGARISEAWNARLYAPAFDSSSLSYVLDARGRIVDVRFSTVTNEFLGGHVASVR